MPQREHLPNYRAVLRKLREHDRVSVKLGRKHWLIYVDDQLVTVLSKGRRASCNPNSLKASLRELRKAGIEL